MRSTTGALSLSEYVAAPSLSVIVVVLCLDGFVEAEGVSVGKKDASQE